MMRRARHGVVMLAVAVFAAACAGPFQHPFQPTDECRGFDRLTRCGQVAFTWMQGFDGGSQLDTHKSYECRARAVRRELIIQ